MSKNLTSGKPFQQIVGFLGTVCAGSALMQIYSAVSTLITGHYLGVDAIGGISSAGQISGMVQGFLVALMCGFAIPMTKAFGADDRERICRYLWWGLILGLSLSLLAVLILLPLRDILLHAIKLPQENYASGSSYLLWAVLAIPPIVLYNLTFYICHALGDGKLAASSQGVVAALTLISEILFLVVLGWDAAGVAVATLVSNAAGGIMTLVVLLRKNPELRFRKEDLRFHPGIIRSLMRNGLPNAGSNSMLCAVGIIVQTAINSMGSHYVNAYALGTKLFSMLNVPASSVDSTYKTYLCQNAGAGRVDRIRQGYRIGIAMGAVFTAVYLALVTNFTPWLVEFLVGGTDGQTVELVRQYLVINGAVMIAWCVSTVYRHTPPALGRPGTMAVSGLIEAGSRMVACAIIYRFGFIGACLLQPIGWVIRGVYDIVMSYVLLHKAEAKYAVK